MPGPPTPGTPPPEVPEEFAAAYRAAYEAALEAQSVPAPQEVSTSLDRPGVTSGVSASLDRQVVTSAPIELPERTREIRVGTHRVEAEREPTAYERVRDSRGFVPALLMLLAMILVVGAYVVGRLFAARVGG